MVQKILVIGVTGQQGGSVAKFLVNSGHWEVHGLTRDPNSAKAKAAAKLGVTLHKGDLNNKEQVKNALKGMYGVFAVTDFWKDPLNPKTEVNEGMSLADAIAEAGTVRHVIFSSLENVKELTGGRLNVPHFDGKAQILAYMKKLQLPVTEVRLPFYYENFGGFMPLQKDQKTGGYHLELPKQAWTRLEMMAVSDLGGVLLPVWDNPQEWVGKTLAVSGDSLTLPQIAGGMEKALGKPVSWASVPYEKAAKGGPVNEDLANMFQYFDEFEGRYRDMNATRALYPQLQSFDEYLAANAGSLSKTTRA